MNQSPLKKHNNHYALTFKGIPQITEVSKPIFYELKNFNEDWRTTFKAVDLFDQILLQNFENQKLLDFMFTDEFAEAIQSEGEEPENLLEAEIIAQFNNFVNDLFYGNVESCTSTALKTAILRVDPDVKFNTVAGAQEAYVLICNNLFRLFPKKLEFYRSRDSGRFKRELKELEIEIKDLKEQFFVKEISMVFGLRTPPDQLLFALKALAFCLTDRIIDWNRKGFTIKEICDFLLRMKPWDLTRKQRAYLKIEFFSNELWDLHKIAKQSQPGVIMARWLEANVQAAELIENIKTQSKFFRVSDSIDYSYFRLPGGANWAVAHVKFNIYPKRGSFLGYILDQLTNNLDELRKQGFKNKYLDPKWILIVSGPGFTLNELESHREERGLVLKNIYTGYQEMLKHGVSVNPDTGFLRIQAPDGTLMRPQDIGPFRAHGMLYH
jgi:hypothetical protein